jgi:hypothetical protein
MFVMQAEGRRLDSSQGMTISVTISVLRDEDVNHSVNKNGTA